MVGPCETTYSVRIVGAGTLWLTAPGVSQTSRNGPDPANSVLKAQAVPARGSRQRALRPSWPHNRFKITPFVCLAK